MELVQSILDKNPYYIRGKKIKPRGIVLRSAGCAQPSAKVFINNWNRQTYDRACVHAFVDANDGLVYQTLPWDHKGHYGLDVDEGRCICVTLCEPAQIKYSGKGVFTVSDANYNAAYRGVKRTYDSAVELCVMLCSEFGLDPDTNIHSYMECATNFNSFGIQLTPEHLWSGLKMKYTMDMFREDVKKEMVKSHNRSEKHEDDGRNEALPVEETVYKVEVTVPNLCIRLGPGRSYDSIDHYAPTGVVELTEISDGVGSAKGWGKLKSGEGWISLDYTKPLIGCVGSV